jgi:hypothetical protein
VGVFGGAALLSDAGKVECLLFFTFSLPVPFSLLPFSFASIGLTQPKNKKRISELKARFSCEWIFNLYTTSDFSFTFSEQKNDQVLLSDRRYLDPVNFS